VIYAITYISILYFYFCVVKLTNINPISRYVTFMSMTWERDGLKVLKQLALNSITYSAMSEKEKESALHKWHTKWNQFIEEMDKIPASVSLV